MTFIFSIHYFLWYGSHTSIFGYESVYARHYANASTVQYGTLRMVLPFAAVILTPIICSMADRNRAHRSYFTIALVLTALSMIAFSMLPATMSVLHRHPIVGYNHMEETTNKSGDNLTNKQNNNYDYDGQQHWWFGHRLDSNVDEQDNGNKTRANDQHENGLLIGPWIFYCIVALVYEISIAVNTCLSDSFAVLQAEEKQTSFGRIIVWGTFGWAASALILSVINQADFMPRLLPGLLFGSYLSAVDVVVCCFWCNNDDFKLDRIPVDAASTVTGSSSPGHRDASDYLPHNESAKINLGTEETSQEVGGGRRRVTQNPIEMIANHSVSLPSHSKMITAPNGASTTIVASPGLLMKDGEAVKTIESGFDLDSKNNSSRDNGAKNMGHQQTNRHGAPISAMPANLNAATTKTANSLSPISIKTSLSSDSPDPYSLPTVEQEHAARLTKQTNNNNQQVILSNVPLESRQPMKEAVLEARQQHLKTKHKSSSSGYSTSLKIQWLLLCLIVNRRRSLIRYLILFILSGFFMSMHWNYFFLYLEQIYYDKFELISALSMVSQSLLGELPFFILSSRFIDWLGRSHTLSLSLVSIGFRFLLYQYLLPNANMYLIFLADCLQGPNYGLFYVVMTEVGLEYSYCDDETIEYMASRGHIDRNDRCQVDSLRLALRSTIQSVAFACYEGVGVGLGSLVGGWLLAAGDFGHLWLPMACGALAVGLANVALELWCREADPELDGSSSLSASGKTASRADGRDFGHAPQTGTLGQPAGRQGGRPSNAGATSTTSRGSQATATPVTRLKSPIRLEETIGAKLAKLMALESERREAQSGRRRGQQVAPAR